MLSFSPLSLDDRKWLLPVLQKQTWRSADFNFTTLFVWQHTYRPEWALWKDTLLIRYHKDGKSYFSFPLGEDCLAACALLPALAEDGHCTVVGIPETYAAPVQELLGAAFEVVPEPISFDYVYSAKKLANLAGKKLHAKRNHIHRFESLGSWAFRPITEAELPACRMLLCRWFEENGSGFEEENAALEFAFAHYSELELEGGLLVLNDQPVAFTIGDRLSADTYDIHFEKALTEAEGAYSMINREFVRELLTRHPDIQYINREDDMGLEGLRKSKMSYYPEIIVKKYKAHRRKSCQM